MEEKLIKETLQLAKKGLGRVSPNPMVGAVIVKNGEIISRGYHRIFGGDHAEIDVIKNAKKNIKGSTIYVNLEPCCHSGKTPPCAETLFKKGIKKVVIGDIDPNPVVKGKGIRYLKEKGLDVVYGILTDECKKLNEIYYKYITTGMPYISLKIAQTLDAKISKKTGKKTIITSTESRRFVHKLRSIHDAVLIGKRTAVIDNPLLNVRLYIGRSPKRIILDENLKIDTKLRLLNNPLSKDTIIFTTKDYDKKIKEKILKKGVEIYIANKNKDGNINLKDMLKKIAKHNISSIFVEGGSETFASFIKDRLVDKFYLFIAPKVFLEGINTFDNSLRVQKKNSNFNLKFEKTKKIGNDLLIEACFFEKGVKK